MGRDRADRVPVRHRHPHSLRDVDGELSGGLIPHPRARRRGRKRPAGAHDPNKPDRRADAAQHRRLFDPCAIRQRRCGFGISRQVLRHDALAAAALVFKARRDLHAPPRVARPDGGADRPAGAACSAIVSGATNMDGRQTAQSDWSSGRPLAASRSNQNSQSSAL